MTHIIFVRHGQTDWNAIGRIQGGLDVPLNKEGLREARELAAQLSVRKIDVIFSSELSRSYVTAEEIARSHKLKVRRAKELNELNQGLWQGLLLTEIKKRYKKQYNLWRLNPTLVRPPKGEDIESVYERVSGFMRKITDKHPDKTVCIVSHEIIMGLIKCRIKGLDVKEMWSHTLPRVSWEALEAEGGAA